MQKQNDIELKRQSTIIKHGMEPMRVTMEWEGAFKIAFANVLLLVVLIIVLQLVGILPSSDDFGVREIRLSG